MNRVGYDVSGTFLDLPPSNAAVDCYHGNNIVLASPTDLEALGFGCVFLTNRTVAPTLSPFLVSMRGMTAAPLSAYSNVWIMARQSMTLVDNTPIQTVAPAGMTTLPAGIFLFNSTGVEVEGPDGSGVGFQFPWEVAPARGHLQRLRMPTLHMDVYL